MSRGADVRAAFGSAVLAVAAMAIVAGVTAAVVPRADLAILAGSLALMLSRSRLIDTWRGRVEGIVALPLVALGVTAVGFVLRVNPWLGAALFTAAMAGSVWLRRFGPQGSRVGSLLALPLLTLLVSPVGDAPPGSGPPAAVVVPIVAVTALVVVVVLRMLGERTGLVTRAAAEPGGIPEAPGRLRPPPSTRMAVQLGLALAAAWVLGLLLVPGHATWIVLSAYLVLARARGRAEVLLTGGLRLGGAVVGTLAAVPLVALPSLDGWAVGAVVILLLGIGSVLRAFSYAWWALVVTLVITVLQHETTGVAPELGLRLVAILVGCLLGALAAWFVLPIRSEGVLRVRLASVLASLDEYWSGGRRASVDRALARLEEVAAPWRAIAWIPRDRPRRAARWIELVREIADHDPPADPPRETLAATRRAIRDPEALLAQLERLRADLG